MFCVGLTGGIGSGKSTAAHFFSQLGVEVIDADEIARKITAPNSPGLSAIVKHFGPEILINHDLDRKKLRAIIFSNLQEKQWLESTLHPLILDEISQLIQKIRSPYCVVVIPLLLESQLSFDFLNRICVVDAPLDKRRQWAASRDQTSLAEIDTIIATQASRECRLDLADDIIVNNQDLKNLKSQVKRLHQQYLTFVRNTLQE